MDRPLLFGKYCLLERISVGGMAEVFRAKPLDAPDPDHYFAVKRILPHLAEDVEFIKMFVDEARLTVQLEHSNIVQTYELGQFQSSHYIVMEFVAGKDLLAFQKHVRNQGTIVDANMACHIVRKIAQGLDYAHNKTDEAGNHLGIIHRDISPQNILVSWDGRIRIIDFGIAKATSQSTKTKAGVMKGKFGYMSPEQVRGESIDHRSDIFAMGTLLWELLTNKRLFKAGNQLEAMTMIGDPEVDPPSTINDEVPRPVDDIVMKALASNPDERYHWGAELAEDLQRFLKSQKPPYHPSQLTTWIRNAFRQDFEEEKEKRQRFRGINTADDVRRLSDETYGEGGADADQDGEEATGVWDVDEAPDTGEDLENFVTDHTVVQAGGLDLSDFDEWDVAPDTIDETEEVVESRLDGATGDAIPQVKISADSQYEAEETVITDPDSMSASSGGSPTSREVPPPSTGNSDRKSATSNQRPPSSGPDHHSQTGATRRPVRPASANQTNDTASSTARAEALDAAPTPPHQTASSATSTTGDAQPPSKTSTGAKEAVEGATASLLDNPKVLVAAGLALGVVLLGSVGVFLAVADSEEGDQDIVVGDLVVDVAPVTTDLDVYVDGRWLGGGVPIEIEGLEPGTYSVEVDHPDHRPWIDEAVVAAGDTVVVDADLGATGRLAVEWDGGPDELELLVDGRRLDADGDDGRVELEKPRGTYLLEAYASDVRPIRKTVTVKADATHDVELDWRPVDRLRLDGEEDREVELDGELRAEELPVILTELDVDRIYELRVGDDDGALGYPEFGYRALDTDAVAALEGRKREAYGWLELEVDSDERWQLLIDDVDSGLTVPLEDDEMSLPVVAGDRVIGLQRGEIRYEYDVSIHPEETTQFRSAPDR